MFYIVSIPTIHSLFSNFPKIHDSLVSCSSSFVYIFLFSAECRSYRNTSLSILLIPLIPLRSVSYCIRYWIYENSESIRSILYWDKQHQCTEKQNVLHSGFGFLVPLFIPETEQFDGPKCTSVNWWLQSPHTVSVVRLGQKSHSK